MKKLFLIALMAVCFCQVITAQDNAKIDVDLQQEMALRETTDLIRINIILNQQYEQMEMRTKASIFPKKEARRSFVVNELKRFSEETQRGVMDLLSTMPDVSEVQSFWIANFINCYANIDAIEELSLHPDVLIIGFDKEQYMLPGEGTSIPANPTREITYNVLKVQADQVWQLGYEGEDIIVAVVDTGVNYNHNDLKTHMWEHPDYPNHGWNFVNNGNNPMDDHGHGTHCAGTVAGDGTSGSQTGMAPKALIMALKVWNYQGSGSTSQMCSGIQFGVDKGAHVISMSGGVWGGGSSSERVQFRNTMINALEAGVVASIAAGNEHSGWSYSPIPNQVRVPGNCPPPWLHPDQTLIGGTSAVVCVGATDINDNIASFSSWGPVTWQGIPGFDDYPYPSDMGLIRPDVCAPGVNIKSLAHYSNTGYESGWDGTSMAAPCVSGVMALMLSKNVELTPAQICEILETTALHLPSSTSPKGNTFGSGRINALEAVTITPDPVQGIVFESLEINDSEGNNNGRLNPGETVHLTVSMKNITDQPIPDVQVTFTTSDALVTIVNGEADFGDFAAEEIKTVENAFTITLSEDAVNQYEIAAILEAAFEAQTQESQILITVYDYVLEIMDVKIANENGEIEPGETSDVWIYLQNTGDETASNLTADLTTSFSYLTINNATAYYGQLHPEQYKYRAYNVTLSPDIPTGTTEAPITLTVTEESGRTTVLDAVLYFKNTGDLPQPCNPVEELSAEIVDSDIKLAWNAPSGGTPEKYLVYCNDLFLGETTEITYLFTDAEPQLYHFCVEALYAGGCTSEAVCVEIMPCDINVELTLDDNIGQQFLLSWLPVVENVKFRIFKNSEFLIEVEENEYLDTDIELHVEYCYTVTAVCPGGLESEPSNEVCGNIVGIDELQNDIKIYPNPTDGQLIIDNGQLTIENVEILDMMGKCVATVETLCATSLQQPTTFTIDISNLPIGIYFIRIQTENEIIIKKVVKQ
jgi:subtilisin family serine protease